MNMKIGYQMYSAYSMIRNSDDLRNTILKLAEFGYDGIEMLQYYDMAAHELKRLAADCGMQLIATHIHSPRWAGDGTLREIEYAKEAGIDTLVYPFIEAGMRTADGYAQLRDQLAYITNVCAENGIELQYHNHFFEFDRIDNKLAIDILLESDKRCKWELDTFWAHYAGVSPVETMREMGDRIRLIHMKDYERMATIDPEFQNMPQFCPIGKGKMESARIVQAAEETHKEWIIVELDNSTEGILESAKSSLAALREMVTK